MAPSTEKELSEALETKATIAADADAPPSSYDRWSLQDDSKIDYGYYSGKDKSTNNTGNSNKKNFYITTAINYTNGPAHMGHAYEAATSDALARFGRLARGGNANAYFVTGADEHGQKIANRAEEEEKEPIDICNKYVTGFKCLNQRILISNDDYVRTTSDRHKRTARELWTMISKAGDIYLDSYSGWYMVREERYVTDSEAQLWDYKDPTSGLPLKQVQEESYFFRMSKYHDKLIEHIETNPNFIRPEQHRNQILTRLKADELRDLSISRTSFSWGIPVPNDDKHVMYVWLDALSNYLTGVDALNVEKEGEPSANKKHFWPAHVHIIGKDILWFHTVIWPCLLMSAGLPLPDTVFAHGFVNDKEGKKMSKSLGNVVDPHDMLDKFPVDTFRWYLCKEAPYGGELSFSEDSMRDMHNADLVKTLGNLVHRATSLTQKYCDGQVPNVPAPSSDMKQALPDFATMVDTYKNKMENYELEGGANIAIQGFRDLNGYLTEEAPWLKKGDEHAEFRQVVVRATLEAIYALTHMLLPFIPKGASDIFQKLGTPPKDLESLDVTTLRNLSEGTVVQVGEVLYPELFSEEEMKDKAEASRKKAEAVAEAQRRKKEKKAKAVAHSKAQQQGGGGDSDQPEFTKIEIRVGQITKVWNHPDADKLFCEEINLGADDNGGEPRQIASGLREHYTLDDMMNRKVLVVCNLKAAKIVGFASNGMVLAAKAQDGSGKVELIDPPHDAEVGERVFIEGLSGEPLSSTQVKKKKIWEKVAKELKTVDGGIATWTGKPIQTSKGPCQAQSLVGAPIS
mmetsp:Transcript_14884/g.21039  ORF Transcript_14884/g.21039 Transcript_14884/m.21039 type:complete len:799 (-) Transcript_14884:190-2586(-)